MKIEIIDLDFMNTRQIIASFLLLGDDGASAALVETGPTNCLDRLTAGLKARGVSSEDVRQVGYPHLADPSKLVKSATRIYGERMDELWGEARPVAEDRIKVLKDGEETETAGGVLVAHDTPGHAYHHLAYLEPGSGALFTGDVAGIRLPGQSYVRPPTPPPEIDVKAWLQSINYIRQIDPASLWPTHFGSYEDVGRHLGELEQRLQNWLLFVEGQMDDGADRERISDQLKAKGDAEMLAEGSDITQSERYDLAGTYSMLTDGLMRYVTRQREKR